MKFTDQLKFIALSIGLTATTCTAAFAGFNQGDAVTINGHPIFRISGSAEGFTPEKRAWQAQDALDNALFLSQNDSPSAVSIARKNSAYVLQLDGHYIATADENSAKAEGMTPMRLADNWAASLKDGLANGSSVQNYIATLKSPHQLQGEVVAVERQFYAPKGTALPVAFSQDLRSTDLIGNQYVTAKVTENVPLGNYYIPADSVLIGNAIETQPGVFQMRMHTLRTPGGSEMPIDAVLTQCSTTI